MTDQPEQPEQPAPKRRGRPPGIPGIITRAVDYKCMTCKLPKERDDLVVKRVVFSNIGRNGKQLRARSVGFICSSCLATDVDWNREAWKDAPGMKEPNNATKT